MKQGVLLLWLLVVGAVAKAGSVAASDETMTTVGALEFRDCLVESPQRHRYVQCSTVQVPENYNDPEGRQITLFIVRLPASAARTSEDPFLAIAGGPGQAASDSFLWLDRGFQDLSQRRDIYLIDQRGTGRSNPQACDLEHREDLLLAEGRESFREVARECLAQFDGDPRQYVTPVAVKDFERVRKALGAKHWNLYGVSYGTRVVQAYMRDYPDAVRTAVMDGVLPAAEILGPQVALESQAALDALVEQCENEEPCRETYPDLESGIASLFERLGNAPVDVRYRAMATGDWVEEAFHRAHLVAVVRMALYNSELLSVLPSMLARAYREEDFSTLARMSHRLDISRQLSMGMHNSVVCSEDVPFIDTVPEQALEKTYMGAHMVEALRGLCDVWPQAEIDPRYRTALDSSIPTLLLSGARDPITPPAYAEQVLQGLDQGRHITVPHRGHGVGALSCVPRLVAQFVDSKKTGELRTACLDRLNPVPVFLNLNGPSP